MNQNRNKNNLHNDNNNLSCKFKNLVDLIENSTILTERIDALKRLDEISIFLDKSDLDQANFFAFFENLLISDSNEKIRKEASLILFKAYSSKALDPLDWALLHETSIDVLSTIFSSLISIINSLVVENTPESKNRLINLLNTVKDKEFRIEIDSLKLNSSLSSNELGDILRNYYAYVYIKRRFWRVKYNIQYCKIVELDFIFKGLSHLPIAIKYLTDLKILGLRYNQISYLPEWLGDLKSLENLNVNINNLNSLPQSIGNLKNLKELSLWKNELRSIPDSIGNLINLKKLNLRLNQIEYLPQSMGNLSSLYDLNLHDNKLESLPTSFTMLTQLKALNLSWNALSKLPEAFGNLINLETLDLERNQLNIIPASIGNIISLEYLNLRDNKLKVLPESFSNLKNLKSLNLSRNLMEEYPEIIMNCPNLKDVYIGENKFTLSDEFEEKLIHRGIIIHV